MNPHPKHTGEYLAQHCLDEAAGDYAVAADLLMAEPDGVMKDHAMKALALWAAFWPLANDD
ncbi:MAG TPA: hypothetical protein VJM34_06940 [Novosphingobium sp.]|nr:hypothetical protein [Novosphingobium sp.]